MDVMWCRKWAAVKNKVNGQRGRSEIHQVTPLLLRPTRTRKMKACRTLLSSAVTRRRTRSTVLHSTLPPAVDLIGPPCPLSNLRPVYYSPLFPSLHSPPSISKNQHPYSPQEFASSHSAPLYDHRQQRLHQLKRKLHAQDLEWRLTRYRFDQFNQHFWARTNTSFLLARDAYVANLDPSSTNSSSAGTVSDVDLAPFYAQHLKDTKKVYAEYNAQLWKAQARLLWPALKAVARGWKWRWEVWKAGGEK